jgi:hypothetical protein
MKGKVFIMYSQGVVILLLSMASRTYFGLCSIVKIILDVICNLSSNRTFTPCLQSNVHISSSLSFYVTK